MAMDVSEKSGDGRQVIKGWHVLAALIGFFGVIFAVNGAFLYFALGSYTGVVSQEPYRKGLAYNDRIAADQRQAALGWTRTLKLDAAGQVALTLRDQHDRPVSGLQVMALIGRPSTAQHDVTVRLLEGPAGVYNAAIARRDSGAWIVSLTAKTVTADGAAQTVYRVKERIWLKP